VSRIRCKGRGGFTLLELLVALAIFSLIAVMAYGGLAVVLAQQGRTNEQADRLSRLQMAYQIMQRDIEQVIARPIRDAFGDERMLMIGVGSEGEIEFTRGGWNNPAGHKRSTLQRVAYRVVDQELVRSVWYVLDRAQDTEPFETAIIDGVKEMEIRFLGDGEDWLDQWPPSDQLQSLTDLPQIVPRAVEISIDIEFVGPLIWLFRIGD
jgi:general secretion pathway protein J